jgi:hypothetical protein
MATKKKTKPAKLYVLVHSRAPRAWRESGVEVIVVGIWKKHKVALRKLNELMSNTDEFNAKTDSAVVYPMLPGTIVNVLIESYHE